MLPYLTFLNLTLIPKDKYVCFIKKNPCQPPLLSLCPSSIHEEKSEPCNLKKLSYIWVTLWYISLPLLTSLDSFTKIFHQNNVSTGFHFSK